MIKEAPLGVLEVLSSGSGFIRRREDGYVPGNNDIYVGQKLIQKFDLRSGDEIAGDVGGSPGRGKSAPLTRLATVNGRPPESLGSRPNFQRLSALHPDEQIILECGLERRGQPDYTNRVIDILCPFGKGQRALIVAPAKAGKTMVLQAIAEGIVKNYPDSDLLILLVDERPEEVTEMEQCGYGEVIASSFDHPAERHVQVAEITLERARRRGLRNWMALRGDALYFLADESTAPTLLARFHREVASSGLGGELWSTVRPVDWGTSLALVARSSARSPVPMQVAAAMFTVTELGAQPAADPREADQRCLADRIEDLVPRELIRESRFVHEAFRTDHQRRRQ